MVHTAIATHSSDGTAQHFKPEISTLLHPAAWHMQDIADVHTHTHPTHTHAQHTTHTQHPTHTQNNTHTHTHTQHTTIACTCPGGSSDGSDAVILDITCRANLALFHLLWVAPEVEEVSAEQAPQHLPAPPTLHHLQ